MNRNKLIKILNQIYPSTYTEKGDPSGWQKIKGPKNIKKILICLDITKEVAAKAIKLDIDLIIHHHPFLYQGKKQSLKINWKHEIFQKFQQHNIGMYAIHTNCDFNPKGMNYYILEQLQAKNIGEYNPYSLLLKGDIEHNDVNKLTKQIKDLFKVKYLNYSSFISVNPLKIIVVAGSGGSFLRHIQNQNYLFITGDLKWNEWMMVQQEQIPVITVGHHMENIFIELVYDKIKSRITEIDVIKYSIENPIKYL